MGGKSSLLEVNGDLGMCAIVRLEFLSQPTVNQTAAFQAKLFGMGAAHQIMNELVSASSLAQQTC